MTKYILRRILLMIPTILGISVVCFALTQFVPGGPVEQVIQRTIAAASERGKSAQISQEELENIRAYFGFNKPPVEQYLDWMGKVLRFDFGTSYVYQKPVWEVFVGKFPISLFFGLTSIFLSYAVCIPLGVAKARRHLSAFDTISSLIIFAGYVIPGFALGVLLIVFFAGGSYLDWFPISGVVSDNFETLSTGGKIVDFLHHMVLPLICFMIGDFAFLTILMKNRVLDEMGRDYIRTALAKGVPRGMAVWRHAVRNALIPVVTNLGGLLTVMFTGALLIERVFEIDGMGLLLYNSILSRDYNVVLAEIVIVSVLGVFGRLISDIAYAIVDPRIRFD